MLNIFSEIYTDPP